MNTNITNFLLSKEQFQAIQKAFKAYYNSDDETKVIKASDFVVYNYLRSKDLGSGFTPITNVNRLKNNGNDKWQGLKFALNNAAMAVKYDPKHITQIFGETITPELLVSLGLVLAAKRKEMGGY